MDSLWRPEIRIFRSAYTLTTKGRRTYVIDGEVGIWVGLDDEGTRVTLPGHDQGRGEHNDDGISGKNSPDEILYKHPSQMRFSVLND